MDLSQYLQNGEENQAEPEQQLSKEEYAALKKQQREEVWGEVDSKAQDHNRHRSGRGRIRNRSCVQAGALRVWHRALRVFCL